MWVKCNPNPKRKEVPDCVVRAISIATGRTWYEVYDDLVRTGRETCSMPSVNDVWGRYLYGIGFTPFLLPGACPDCVTVKRFCKHYPVGTYIIGTGTHAVAVIDGDYYDSWDSGDEVPSYFWKAR